MRLGKYLSYQELDEKTNKFRSLNIKMVETPTDYSCIFKHLKEKHNINIDVTPLLERINKKLREMYRGKHSFALCLDEGKEIDHIKINKRYKKDIKLLSLLSNDKLAKIKKEFERNLI